jgi:hypothetical protein
MIASLVLCCAGLVTAAAEGESCLLVAHPVAGRTAKIVREVHVSLTPAGATQVIDGVETKLDKETAKPRNVSEREVWEERTLAVAQVDGATRSVHTSRRFLELERTTARGTGADVRQKSVVSPLLGRLAYAKQLEDGAWDRAFEGAADWDLRCLASLDAQPPLGDWLPARSVQAGDSWELEPAVIERAFRLDVRELLMPLPKGSEYVPPPQSDVPWRAAKWSGSASVSSIDDKKVLIALRLVGDGVWTAAAKPATVTVEEEGARMTFGSMEPIEETLTTTLKGELVYDRKLGCCTSLQLKGELRCSTSNALGEKGKLIRREQGSFVVKVNIAADS